MGREDCTADNEEDYNMDDEGDDDAEEEDDWWLMTDHGWAAF